MMARRRYTAEFKQAAADLVLKENYGIEEAGKRLGIGSSTISYWVRSYQERTGAMGKVEEKDLRKRVAELERENQRLLREREILKKAAAFFAKEQL